MPEHYLKIYKDKSVYVREDGTCEIFLEGSQSSEAARRAADINQKLNSGYLDNLISGLVDGTIPFDITAVPESLQQNLRDLVCSVTSEVGRALIGLSFLQLTIKTLAPKQCTRLHKGGKSANIFSWTEGISMRTIDNKYITPILRKHNLLSLNADGIMMTRSLAENYPYSSLYKAQLRGAKDQWLSIVEFLETESFNTEEALKLLIKLLINRAEVFEKLADDTVQKLGNIDKNDLSKQSVLEMLISHRNSSDYAARLLEISMHALCQAAIESGSITYSLNPLSQMRSANKKHGNIGDVEFLDGKIIIESWDAKYGKSYLREELEELHEKLEYHPEVEIAGFVTSEPPILNDEISSRMEELIELHGVDISIKTFAEWVDYIFEKCMSSDEMITESDLASRWLEAYTLSLAQRKRKIAPIDEPCIGWLKLLNDILQKQN
ncbi:MAG: hypothetical protein GX574_06180 [Lentisphaerae bacterium]|nr:hypothetical protein [Lentisphaerota bacterium]